MYQTDPNEVTPLQYGPHLKHKLYYLQDQDQAGNEGHLVYVDYLISTAKSTVNAYFLDQLPTQTSLLGLSQNRALQSSAVHTSQLVPVTELEGCACPDTCAKSVPEETPELPNYEALIALVSELNGRITALERIVKGFATD